MRRDTFQAVRQQYGFCCGYCGTSETDTGTTLTIDHYQPRSHGGSDDFANLVYCCHACNEHKGSYWNTSSADRILHPIHDNLFLHYAEQSDFTLLAITDEGRFHISRLQLNRFALIAHRRREQNKREDRQNQAQLLAIMRELLGHMIDIERSINEIRSGGE